MLIDFTKDTKARKVQSKNQEPPAPYVPCFSVQCTMIESVLEFLQGQNARCKIEEALMWLNVSGGMFNLTLLHYNTLSLHAL